jgi:hypothetical protein
VIKTLNSDESASSRKSSVCFTFSLQGSEESVCVPYRWCWGAKQLNERSDEYRKASSVGAGGYPPAPIRFQIERERDE